VKWFARLFIVVVLSLTSLGSADLVLSEGGSPTKTKPEPDQSIKGEVTAISETELTVKSADGQSMTALITDETKLRRRGGGQASLDEIEVGDFVGVVGFKNDDGAILAGVIVVFPDNHPKLTAVEGNVTAIDRETIVVQSRQGRQRIVTNDNTKIKIGKQEASLADIKVGQVVVVKGVKQDDGSFLARIIMAVDPEPLRKNVLQGEVTSVDETAGVFEIEAKGNIWTIKITEQTKYRIPGVDNPTLADVPVGALVAVVGRPDGKDSKSSTARLVIVPRKRSLASGRAAGKVTKLDKTGFTLLSGQGDELTILTDESTEYRASGDGDQVVSAEDVKVGVGVMVTGQPVAGQENTIKAATVSLKFRPAQKEK